MQDDKPKKKHFVGRLLGGMLAAGVVSYSGNSWVDRHNDHLGELNEVRTNVTAQNLGRTQVQPSNSSQEQEELNQERLRYRALDLVNKFRNQKYSLTSEETEFLNEYRSSLSSLSLPQGEKLRKKEEQFRKDINYVAGEMNIYFSIQNARREVSYLRENSKDLGVDLLERVRFRERSVIQEGGRTIIDFWNINSNLLREIITKSQEYDVNLRLALTLFTIENNFGLTKTSSSGARGLGQTKEQNIRKYFPSYNSASESEKDYMAFLTTFEMLKEFRERYHLDISYSNLNEIDYLVALYIYHDGITQVIQRGGHLPAQSEEGHEYVRFGLSALKYVFSIPRKVNGQGEVERTHYL